MTDNPDQPTVKAKVPAKRAKTAAPKPVIARPKTPVVKSKPPKTGVTLRKKDFVDRAAEKSGVRKSDTRSAIDAALAILADALVAGDEVVLPPLGKLRMMLEKDNGKARVLTLRLQIIPEGEAEKRPLAEPQDGG